MGVHVAAAIREKQNSAESLLLDTPFMEIRKFSNVSRKPGRPKKILKDRNRADIVLFRPSYGPVHVIELKRC